MEEFPAQAVVFRQEGRVTVAVPQRGEITQSTTDRLQKWLSEQNGGRRVVLDLSSLDFLGSVGLGMLVDFMQRVRKSGGRLALAGLSGTCKDVMTVTGMNKIFSLYDNVQLAVDAMSSP